MTATLIFNDVPTTFESFGGEMGETITYTLIFIFFFSFCSTAMKYALFNRFSISVFFSLN